MGSVDRLRTWLVQGASKEFDWIVIHGNWVSSPTGKEWHKDLSKAEILRVFAKPAKRLCADNSQPEANMTEVSDEVWKLERDEFAEARSHEASKISYDFGKAAAQAGLIINGGAATAVIALLAKDKVDPIIFKTVPWCLTIYAIGVTASAIMMYCAMMHADRWNFYWYHLAYTADKPSAVENENKASYWRTWLRVSFVVAMAGFLVASVILAVAMAKLK